MDMDAKIKQTISTILRQLSFSFQNWEENHTQFHHKSDFKMENDLFGLAHSVESIIPPNLIYSNTRESTLERNLTHVYIVRWRSVSQELGRDI